MPLHGWQPEICLFDKSLQLPCPEWAFDSTLSEARGSHTSLSCNANFRPCTCIADEGTFLGLSREVTLSRKYQLTRPVVHEIASEFVSMLFCKDSANSVIYTLSLHDPLPNCRLPGAS